MKRNKWYRHWRRRFRALAQGPYAAPIIGGGAFLESSFVPFPFELVFVPAILGAPKRVWVLCTAALLGCLLAAATFYGLGLWFYDAIGAQILQQLGIAGELEAFQSSLATEGFWLIFLTSLLPAPIQIATLGSGLVGYPFWMFMLAILLSRLIRFFGLGLVVALIGEQVTEWIKNGQRHSYAVYGTSLVVLVCAVAIGMSL